MSPNPLTVDPGSSPPRPDKPSLRELLPQHLGDLSHYVQQMLCRTLRDHESASDLVGSVCGDLLVDEVAFEYRSEPQFQCWLRTVVLNKVRNRLRYHGAKKRSPELVIDVGPAEIEAAQADRASPSHHAILHEDLSLLDRALERLPEDYRTVIVQIHLLSRTHAQAAEMLGRSVEATRTLLTRAKVKLAGELDRLHANR